MKVSVLMPSRGRPDLAKQSIKSLGKGDFEVLIATDQDDETRNQLAGHNTTAFAQRHGYGQLQIYYNTLSEKAKGDWLMLWNDDAVMETEGWVDKIAQFDHTKPMVLNPWGPETDNLFPVISRKWYEIVGHFSMNTHADSWVQQIGERLNLQVYVPGIKITHQGENLNDTTHQEVREVVRETSAKYRGMERERIEDANKIEEWCRENNYNM
jgi:hypothetical protein